MVRSGREEGSSSFSWRDVGMLQFLWSLILKMVAIWRKDWNVQWWWADLQVTNGIASKCNIQPTDFFLRRAKNLGCIKIFTTLKHGPISFSCLCSFSSAFSIHEKYEEFSHCNLTTDILSLSWWLFPCFGRECIFHQKHGVRSVTNFEWSSWKCCRKTNGLGTAATCGLENLQENLEKFSLAWCGGSTSFCTSSQEPGQSTLCWNVLKSLENPRLKRS